MLVELPWYI